VSGTTSDLATRHCSSCGGGTPLALGTARELLLGLKAWEILDGKLVKTYAFRNYYETMAFVNGLALVSHREDHHPELIVNYNKCEVRYHTHSTGGMTENDFICAAKADALLRF